MRISFASFFRWAHAITYLKRYIIIYVVSELVLKLNEWADANRGDQSDFLREAASALADPEQRAAWSFVDISGELERRGAIRRGAPWVVQMISVISYLLPIFVTWLHLRSATNAFASAALKLAPGDSIDFLAFWSGAEGGYAGTLLPMVSVHILISLVVIAAIQLVVGWLEPIDRPAVSSELRALALQVQLLFFQSRSITPRELVDAMGIAANQLGDALKSTKDSLVVIEQVAGAVISSATTLNQVSDSLRNSAESISIGVTPLMNLPRQLNEIVRAMANAADYLTETQTALAGTTSSVDAVMSASKSAAEDVSKMSAATKDVLRVVTEAQVLVKEVAVSIRDAANASQNLGVVVTEHEPHIAILNSGIKELVNSVSRLDRIAQEFKYSADKYAEVNVSHRNQSS